MISARSAIPGIRREELFGSLGLTFLLCGLYVSLLVLFGPTPKMFALVPVLAILLVLVSSLELAFVAVVASLFIDYPISWFSLSVWVAMPLGLAVFWRFRNEPRWDLSTPLTRAVVFYGLCVIPSLLTTTVPFSSGYRMLNLVAFFIVLYGSIVSFRDTRQFIAIAVVYLICSLINSLDVIVESVVFQRRSYGFTGIMFVDYSAMAVCVSATLAIVTRGWKRYAFGATAAVVAMALILTQTRNTWLSASITLALLSIYLLRRPGTAGLSRREIVRLVALGAVVLGLSVGVATVLNPGVQARTAEITSADETTPVISEAGRVSSSLISRVLIWSTAYNAFVAHPLTGTGVYSFPFISKDYSSIHPYLYKRYVQNLTPHQTHVAVLSETGIIGFIGFVVFIVTVLRISLRAVARARGPFRQRAALVLLVATVYAVVSMTFTDAWLWGPLIILFGLVLGLMIANDKAGERSTESAGTGPA